MNNADLIIKSKAIFDSAEEEPFEGWVAVKGNRIMDVGKGTDCAYEKDCKNVRDVGNKTVMYAFHDNHVHFLMAGMYKTCVNLADAKNEEEAAKMVKDFYDKNGAGDWVLGFGWYHVFWDNKTIPSKKSLDKYFPDIPVFLLNAEAHGAWINSKAMEIAGITKDIPDPEFGIIERDENGEPSGFLYEGATGLAAKYALVLSPEQEKKTIRAFMDDAKTLGITSITDVMPYFGINMGHLDIYHEMDVDNELTVRVHAAPDVLGDLDEAEEWREKFGSEKLRVDHMKQFLDGVSTTQTALLTEPYSNHPETCGTSLFDLESIGKAVPEAHKRGFSVKLHSCGDMSARIGLNYFENAIKMYGKNKCRHAIEHCELIDPTDLPRFKELGVIPSVQPEHIALTQEFKENPYLITMGPERAGRTWPLLSLYKQAGVLAIGSDCPVVDNNPFLEIYRGITRLHNDGEPKGGWNPTEKLSLYQVLRSYTYGSAYASLREDEMGTLEKGKLADIVVIDRNLFEATPDEIFNAKVDMTVMDGSVIYER